MKVPDDINVVIVAVGRFLSESFPDSDLVLIVSPKGQDKAMSITNVQPEAAKKIAQNFVDQESNWRVKVGIACRGNPN
jgi:hypothetical protein